MEQSKQKERELAKTQETNLKVRETLYNLLCVLLGVAILTEAKDVSDMHKKIPGTGLFC